MLGHKTKKNRKFIVCLQAQKDFFLLNDTTYDHPNLLFQNVKY